MAGLRGYLIRAVYDWAVDAGHTPYIVVDITKPGVSVPPGRAEEGRITLNIHPSAVRGLSYDPEAITFSARFGGAPFLITLPIPAVLAIFARENGRGLSFEGEPDEEPPEPSTPPTGPPSAPRKVPMLRRIK
ncbi:MAG: stringent starvation protein B [Acidiferrobacter sp.]